MHYQISGSGKTIVFIHGYCETLNIWNHLESELSKSYQIVLIDLPGFGKSELETSDFSLKDIANQIRNLLLDIGISEYFMIGHSLGGYISMALAENHPENLLGIGLFHSSVFADNEQKRYIRDKTVQFVSKHGTKAFTDTFIGNLFYEGTRGQFTEEIEQMTQEIASTNPNSVMAYSLAMKNRSDTFGVWESLEKPVFLIAGENDAAVPLVDSQKIIDNISVGEGIILSETAHMGFVERKKECLDFIRNFLTKYVE